MSNDPTTQTTALALAPAGTRPHFPGRSLTIDIAQLAILIAPQMKEAAKASISPAKAAATMMMAYEFGFNMTAAFNLIHWIDGPSLSAEAMLALLINSRLVQIKITPGVTTKNEPMCTVWMSRRDQPLEFETTFSMDDARRAELVKPRGGWDKYPKRMVMWRAISDCASVVAPDIIAGLHVADFDLIEQEPPEVKVDPATGEIIEEATITVVSE